jgi:hypothetical protein
MMRRLCVGLAAVLALVAPAAARADWSAPRQISAVQPGLETPRLAFDGQGDVFSAWDQGDARNLFAAVGSAKPQLLGDDVVLDDVSASRNGSALLVATGRNRHGGRIETFVRRPGGHFRPSQVLDRIPRPYAYFHHALLGADPAGDAAVVWTRARRKHPDSPLLIAARRHGGRFGRTRAVSKAGVTAFALAMNPTGRFVVAWVRGTNVEARVGRGATLGPVRRLGAANSGLPPVVAVAIDGHGNALVAWLGASDIELSYHQAGFGFGAPRAVPHEPGAGFGGHMALAFTTNEHAVLALDGASSDGAGIFTFDVFQGAASPAIRLAPPPSGALGPRLQGVATGPRGQVAVWWATLRAGSGYTGVSDLFASYRDTGTFSAPAQVSTPNTPLADTSGFPVSTVRFDPISGNPVALWIAAPSGGQVDAVETSTRR